MAEPAVAANSGPVGGGPPLTSGGPKTTVLHCKALGAGLTGVVVVNPNHEIGACKVAG